MANLDFEIRFEDTSVPNLLDHHYSFLEELSKAPQDTSRIAYFNSITPFTALSHSPFFNLWMFRTIADSQVLTSPITLSLIGQGDLNNNRFSYHYDQLINQVYVNGMSEEDADKDGDLDDIIREKEKTWRDTRRQARREWNEEAKAIGLKPTDPNYQSEMEKFIEIEWGDTLILAYSNLDDAKKAKREHYIKSTSAEYRKFDKLRSEMAKEVGLPKIRTFEEEYFAKHKIIPGTDFYLDFNSSYKRPLYEGLSDFRAGTFPLTTIEDALDDTKAQSRSYEFKSKEESKYKHNSKWSASVKKRSLFFKGSASASVANSVKETAKAISKVSFGFKDIREIPVVRAWYDSTIFERDDVKEILENNPDLAKGLRFGVTSVILCRGMAATIEFDSEYNLDKWREVSGSASGSKSVLGFSLGGASGSYYAKTEISEQDIKQKRINFIDSDQALRIVGVRVHENPTGVTDTEAALQLAGPADLLLSSDGAEQVSTYVDAMFNGFVHSLVEKP